MFITTGGCATVEIISHRRFAATMVIFAGRRFHDYLDGHP
jgi:hypothetical protein